MLDSSGKTLVIAHSGCMGNPDDTLAFFSDGHSAGADGFEVDLNLTSDGICVLAHDDVISDDDGNMLDLSLTCYEEALRRKKELVLFREAVEKAREYDGYLNIDVKNIKAVPIALDIVKRLHYTGKSYFTGILPQEAEILLKQYPGLVTAVNLKMNGRITTNPEAISDEAREATVRCREIGAAGINVEWELCSRAWIDFAHRLGLLASCWTLDEEQGMREVLSWGTDMITTSRPDILCSIIKGGTHG